MFTNLCLVLLLLYVANMVTLGERAFHELPLQLRNIGSVEIFKNSIKTFLFRQFFQ